MFGYRWFEDPDQDDRIEQQADDLEYEYAGRAEYFGEGRIANYPDSSAQSISDHFAGDR